MYDKIYYKLKKKKKKEKKSSSANVCLLNDSPVALKYIKAYSTEG